MTDLSPPKAILRRDGAAFMMARGNWRSSWFAIDRLKHWRKLYADLAARKGGAYAKFYEPWIAVLDELARKIREQNQ